MGEFENVTVVRAANVYFDGAVSSRTIKFADGQVKTLGFMLPGEYTFNTDKEEIMDVHSGDVEVKSAGSNEWQSFAAGDSFHVPASSSFDIRVKSPFDYCCSFVD